MNNRIAKVISLVVIIFAILVMVGWFLDITFLKSISPNWVSMKFITAICFVLSGVILYLTASSNKKNSDWRDLVLSYTIYVLLLVVMGLGLSIFFNTRTGLEDLFVKEQEGAIYTTLPGRPAISTLFAFLIICVCGLFSLVKKNYCKRIPPYLGVMLVIIGLVAILGYIINYPPLFFQINHISTAMAFHTAVLFVLLGIGYLSVRYIDS